MAMGRRKAKTSLQQLALILVVLFASFPCLRGAFSPSRRNSRHNNNVPYDNERQENHGHLKQQRTNRPSQTHQTTSRSLSLATMLSADAYNSPWMPLYLSCLAGASTCLGAAIVFWHPQRKSIGPNTMSFSLALAGSVMITVSVLSLGPECLKDTSIEGNYQILPLWSRMFLERLISFGLGCLVYRLLSYFTFPDPEDLALEFQSNDDPDSPLSSHHDGREHHDSSTKKSPKLTVRSRKASQQQMSTNSVDSSDSFVDEEKDEQQQQVLLLEKPDYEKSTSSISLSQWSSGADLQSAEQRRAWRVAMLLFVSLLIHNFPEGLAVAASSVQSTKLGMAVTFGIMIHNIPEGICIAVPCLAARPDRPWLAFLLASGSGLAEPLGAALALLVLRNTTAILPMENVLAFVAAIMVMVAVCELFPEAKRHTEQGKEYFVAGTITGILIMAATELYLPS